MPTIQNELFECCKDKLNLNFIGTFKYVVDLNSRIIESLECYDSSVEHSGPVSLLPYSLYELLDGKLIITELVRADFKGCS